MRAVQPDVDFPIEVGLPESSRWIDAVGQIDVPGDAWGVLRRDLGERKAFFELYSASATARNLATSVVKAAWGLEQWLGEDVKTRPTTPPVCVVISNGQPRSGFLRMPCLRPDPAVVGLHRFACGYELVVVDTKRIRGPGTSFSFLRLLPSRLEERADMLKAVYEDPDLSPTTKRAIEEAIMSKPHEFGAAEQALTVEVVEARGEARAQARERETLLEVARRRGVSEARFARLEALESLDALREAVFELLR